MDPETLQLFRAFESRDVVQQECKRVMGREPNSTHAREIACHVVQARQYLDAAARAGDMVRPLLVYYACLTLARAVVMFRTHKREGALQPSHGLTIEDWSQALADGPGDFHNLALKVTSGTFADFVDATGNPETFTYYAQPLSLPTITVCDAPTFDPNAILRIGSIWHRIPQLLPLLHGTHGATGDAWPAFVLRSGNIQVQIELVELAGRIPTENQARRMMGLAPDRKASFSSGPSVHWAQTRPLGTVGAVPALHVLVNVQTEDEFRNLVRNFKGAEGRLYLVEPLSSHLNLSTMALLFVATYAAGMLVRYYPTTWQALARGDKGDRALPVLNRSVELAESLFPRLALSAMLRTP